MEKFVYDIFDTIETPTFVLSNIYHHHIGVINNIDVDSINTNFNMASAQEMSFDVYKEIDGEVCDVWDSIVGLKYVFVPEFNEYYKADVTLNEDNKTVKSVTLTSAGEYELSNKKIVNLEINTESDILQKDYVTTVFYDENNPRGSLLDRVLNDKAPDWSIGHVDDTLKNIQRTFSINGQTVYDTLVNTIAKEINCLFTFDSVNRVINAYDLLNKCSSCGYRGEFLTTCPKCGGKEFIRGYGENSNILINYNNYSEKMTVDGGEDKVKNCFKVTGGDDNMNAAIRNCNPNGSHYIYSFSDADYEDMPPELVQKLIEYGEMYEEILPEYEEVVAQYYNNLNCYHYYKTTMMPRLSGEHWEANKGYNVGDRAYVMTLPTWCYLECVQAGVSGNTEFDATRVTVGEEFIDGTVIWQARKNIIDVPSAQQSLDAIIEYFETNEIYFLNNIPGAITEVNNEVKNIAALQINNIFRIEIILDDDNKVEGNIWTGRIKVYNTGNEKDTATSKNPVTVYLKISSEPMDYINYMSNKVEKRLNKKDVEFTSIFDIEIPRDETTYEYLPDEDTQFKEALTGYGLDWLSNFSKSYQGCIETLISNGVTDEKSNIVGYKLYDPMYVPYYERMKYINNELAIRQATVNEYEALYEANEDTMSDYHKRMNMRTFLGDDLYKTLYNYIREDDYNNTNYISDGLSDGEILQDARTLLELANDELLKANTLQYTLSDSLENLLNTEEFKDHKDKLKIGDYLICEADEKLYRLRLIGVSYGYGSPDKINVTFSNYVALENYFSDAQNILATAKSMSTSYGAVMHQVDKSANVTDEVTTWMEDSLSSAITTITNNDNEEVTIDENGIIAREFDDVSNTYSKEQLRITHNIIAFTDNAWEDSTLGLGKQLFKYYSSNPNDPGWKEDTGYGLNAKFVNSGYIYGTQIVAGEMYSENYDAGHRGSYINLNDGSFDFAGGGLIGRWNSDTHSYDLNYKGDVEGVLDVGVGSHLGTWTVYDDGLYSGVSVLKPNHIYVTGNVTASDFQLGNTLLSSILDKKQAKLNAGTNITLTPEQDGTVTISAAGGGGGTGVLYGTTPPSDSVGNEEDFYLKLGLVESGTISDQSYTCTTVDLDSFSLNNNKYDIEVSGVPQTAWDYIMFQIDGLEEDEDYTVSFDIQFGQGTTFAHGDYGNWSQVLHTSTPSGSYDVDPTRTDAVVFEHNLDLQHCSYTFTAEENNYIIFTFHNCQDWQQFTASISGLSINNGETSDHINAIYNKHNNKWLEYIDKNGGVHYGIGAPTDDLGNDGDIYIEMSPNSSGCADSITYQRSSNLSNITNSYSEGFHKIQGQWWTDRYEHSYTTYRIDGLTAGETYDVILKVKVKNLVQEYESSSELFGIAIQNGGSFTTLSEHVKNGEFAYYEDGSDKIYFQSLKPMTTKVQSYSFKFTAFSSTYILISPDSIVNNSSIPMDIEIAISDGTIGNYLEDVYYKVEGEWLLYDNDTKYVAGDNITITEVDGENVISATDTDAIEDLTDVELDNLSNGQILKYNSTTQKWENGNESGGTPVVANPSGTATADLNKIQVDNTIYQIPQGGGSEVEANPLDPATDTLTTIEIDGTIYDIAGSGGGGSSSYVEEELYRKQGGSSTFSNIVLTKSVLDYDMIIAYSDWDYSGNYWGKWGGAVFTKAQLQELASASTDNNRKLMISFDDDSTMAQYLLSSDGKTLTASSRSGSCEIRILVGLKFGGGDGSAKVITLFDTPTTTQAWANPVDVTFNTDDYDLITVDVSSWDGNDEYHNLLTFELASCDVDDTKGFRVMYIDDEGAYLTKTATGLRMRTTTGYKLTYNKVIGYKFGGGGSNIEPNPQDTPTDTLETIGIDGTVYDISGSGRTVYDFNDYYIENGRICNGSAHQFLTANFDKPLVANRTYIIDFKNSEDGVIVASAVFKYTSDFTTTLYGGSSIGTITMIITSTTITSNNYSGAWQDIYVDVYREISSAEFFYPVIYSTEEREIGVWTDNKPLYEKTIYIGAMTRDSSWHPTAHGISNIEKVVEVCGQTKQSSDGRVYNIPHYRPSNNQGISVGADTTNVYYMDTWLEYASDTYVTVRYTKTTDVAGSGSYNTLGVPTVHYTTDEQVIGTWIDGKPLYRRTWNFSTGVTISSNSWQATDIAVADTHINVITDCKALNDGGQMMNYISATTDLATQTYVMLFNSRTNAGVVVKYLTLEYTKTTDQ